MIAILLVRTTEGLLGRDGYPVYEPASCPSKETGSTETHLEQRHELGQSLWEPQASGVRPRACNDCILAKGTDAHKGNVRSMQTVIQEIIVARKSKTYQKRMMLRERRKNDIGAAAGLST